MTFHWYDWAGYIGVLLVLLAYFLLQARKLHGNKLAYQLMNILGAFGVLLSLTFGNFNWSAFLLEVAWIAIGVYGIARGVQLRRTGRMVD
ncbi:MULTISPECIES: CBU_0592 family membrane protein [unclassified Rhodanobacter]|uniref:CBU-0592-like domain-containing protein n=1 Tax=Rhodanobacter humi TaxID=1888173 RepID=A0ABV4AU80_9GAMM